MRAPLAEEFSQQVERVSRTELRACVQCKKCTSGCPVASRADIKVHELIRLTQLEERERVLACRMIWECTSCQTCLTRCPQQVDLAAINDALRLLSQESGLVHQHTTLPVFNDAFLRSVRRRGRVYDVGLMAAYKLRTLCLLEDMEHLPTMLLKRKLRLLPRRVSGRGERERLFVKARAGGSRT